MWQHTSTVSMTLHMLSSLSRNLRVVSRYVSLFCSRVSRKRHTHTWIVNDLELRTSCSRILVSKSSILSHSTLSYDIISQCHNFYPSILLLNLNRGLPGKSSGKCLQKHLRTLALSHTAPSGKFQEKLNVSEMSKSSLCHIWR